VIYCINPLCNSRVNKDSTLICESCGANLFINQRFKLIKLIEGLNTNDEVDFYEALDLCGSYNSPPNTIKILKVLKSGSYVRREMFQRGAQILKSLVNPRLPSVDVEDYFEVEIEGRWNTLICLAMEKIEGVTLKEWVKIHGKVNQAVALQWMRQLAETLDYIHQAGVIHRDIKPDNIIVKPNGNLVLIDFDGARRITNTYWSKLSTKNREAITTIVSGIYTAPEQLELWPVPQSDFYSLGMTFIYALTGCEPSSIQKNESTGRLMWSKLTPKLDPPFITFINNLIHPSVARRPSHSIDLVNILFVELPRQLRRYELYRSKVFRLSCLVIVAFLSVGLFHLVRNIGSDYFYNAGLTQGNNGNYVTARQSFHLSNWFKQNTLAYTDLARMCFHLGDIDCAKDNYEAATQINPGNDSPWYNLATFYEDQNNYDAAKQTYAKALDIRKDDPSILNNLARLYIKEGEYKNAQKELDKARKLLEGKQDAESLQHWATNHKNQGWLLFVQKNYSRAEVNLILAIVENPNLVSPHCLLAQVNEAMKQPANEEWEKCTFPTKNNIDTPQDEALPEVYEWRHLRFNRNTQVR
jgi:serine/threonine protein kinase